jgi:hypothetical protein
MSWYQISNHHFTIKDNNQLQLVNYDEHLQTDVGISSHWLYVWDVVDLQDNVLVDDFVNNRLRCSGVDEWIKSISKQSAFCYVITTNGISSDCATPLKHVHPNVKNKVSFESRVFSVARVPKMELLSLSHEFGHCTSKLRTHIFNTFISRVQLLWPSRRNRKCSISIMNARLWQSKSYNWDKNENIGMKCRDRTLREEKSERPNGTVDSDTIIDTI